MPCSSSCSSSESLGRWWEVALRSLDHSDSQRQLQVALSLAVLEDAESQAPQHAPAVAAVTTAIRDSVYAPDVLAATLDEMLGPLRLDPPASDPGLAAKLKPHYRRTYAAAFGGLVELMHQYERSNDDVIVKLRRQATVFDRTLHHWRQGLLRNVFVAWRQTIRRNVYLRNKYRALFSRLREDDSKLRAIRTWRDRAVLLRRTTAAEAEMQAQLEPLRTDPTAAQAQLQQLLEQNAALGRTVTELEWTRRRKQQERVDTERRIMDTNYRTVAAERLGTELLNSVLLRHEPPEGETPLETLIAWGHRMLAVGGGSVDGDPAPFAPLLTHAAVTPVALSALGVVLSTFRCEGAPEREVALQIHISPEHGPALLVKACESVTGRPCIVTAEHLATRQRGVLLLFLASLMRFSTQWLQCAPFAEDVMAPHRDASEPPARLLSGEAAAAAAESDAVRWGERLRTQERWGVAALAALNAAAAVAAERQRLLSFEELDDEPHFCRVTAHMLDDLIPNADAEYHARPLIDAVRELFPTVRRLFLAYAVPVLAAPECWRLAKDARLAGGRGQLTRRWMTATFASCRRLTPHGREPVERTGAAVLQGLHPAQFSVLLMHIALFEARRAAGLVEDDDDLYLDATSYTAVVRMIEENALRPDVDTFRLSLRHPQVQEVLSSHAVSLRRVFRRFANCDDGHAMNRAGFQAMARACGWFATRAITLDAVNEVFFRLRSVVAPQDARVDAQVGEAIVDLTEWQECLCAMAAYATADPLRPLADKLSTFIDERVLGALGM